MLIFVNDDDDDGAGRLYPAAFAHELAAMKNECIPRSRHSMKELQHGIARRHHTHSTAHCTVQHTKPFLFLLYDLITFP